jgi:hypothetical protein
MSEEKTEYEKIEIQETETQERIISEDDLSEKASPENNSENDEEDLLYIHKSENRSGSIQWNSNFCRRPGH